MLRIISIILIFIIFAFTLLQPGSVIEGLKSNPFKKAFKSVKKAVNKNVVNPVKRLVTKPKPVPKPLVLPVPAEFASYADNVKPPYVGEDFQQLQSDVNEYKKALNGVASKNMVSQNPLGMLYFHNTGTKCNYNNKLVDKHIIVDSRAGTNLFESANADINKSMQFDTPTYSMANCVPTTIQPIDVYGRTLPKETKYV